MLTKNMKGEKMVGFVKTYNHYHHKFNFGQFFSRSSKTVKGFESNN